MKKISLRAAMFLATWLALSPCLLARVEPTHGFDLFSSQEETQVGQQAAAEISRQLPLLPADDPVTRYVQRLGARLASHAPGEKWPYSFHVVNQKDINAFALPGGAIFVNLGTIQAADNEAQLAGVMAHEISHVVQRHGTRAASKQLAAQLPLAILGGLMGRGALAQMTQLGISFGIGSYFLKNSRQAESEADLLGADVMYDSGYNPHAMAVFFDKLKASGGSNSTAQFFSDHPDPGNRAQAVSREVATLTPRSSYLGDSPDFLAIKRRVAGMKPMTATEIAAWQKQHAAVSPQTAAGVAPDPAMRPFDHSEYHIDIPENWQVFGDRTSSVTIAPPTGVSQNAVVSGVMVSNYQPEDPQASLDRATHDLLDSLRQSNPGLREIGHDEDIRVNGMPGKSVDLIGNSPLQDNSGHAVEERDWLVTIAHRDGSLLYLVFIAPDKDFVALRPTFERILKSLKLP
jgi:Zn-dependent protease with chaperone function